MRKKVAFLIFLPIWAYAGTFLIPYAVWSFALTQNYFLQHGLVLFKDVIYHHTDLPLFILYFSSKIFGNTPQMLQISSFILTVLLGYGIYITTKELSREIVFPSLALFFISFFPLFNNFRIEEMVASIFALFSTHFFLKYLNTHKVNFLFLSGVFAGFGFMSKQSVIGVAPVFLIILIIEYKKGKLFSKLFWLVAGYIIGLAPIVLYYTSKNALLDFYYWNIPFNLFVYPRFKQPLAFFDGMFYGGWLLFAFLPGVLLILRKGISKEFRDKTLLIFLSLLFLAFSLLPSFHEYKLLIFYPYALILWSIVLVYRKSAAMTLLLVLGLILAIFPLTEFYINYLPRNFLHKEYIQDNEKDVSNITKWIHDHTKKNEKIFIVGDHYILTLSERLPANKYVYIFPWLVYPYEKSTREIAASNPRIAIIDNKTLEDWPELEKEWGIIDYVRKNYKKEKSFGTYEIFIKN